MPSLALGKLAVPITLAALASAAQSAVVFSLANDGTSLVRFDTAAPAAVTIVGLVNGAATRLDGLDFRPADGRLYGYQAASSGVYRVDTATGATVLASTSTVEVATGQLGIDFNPVPDRLRVVTVNDENRRINVDTGANATPPDGMLAYAAADPNAGVNPNIIDAAYTNSDRNPATGTLLYYIDFALDTLVTTTNPNAGTLVTRGSLGVDTDRFTGLDILTGPDGSNTAFATLRVGGIDGLYTIDLGSGAASFVGAIGASQLYGLAAAPIPEPGSVALLAAGGLAAFALRRRPAPAATARPA